MHHVVLTEAERAWSRQQQGVEETDLWYCRPCYSVLSNKEQGAQLIKGTLQVNLIAAGVPNAERIAQRMYEMLIKRSASKPVS